MYATIQKWGNSQGLRIPKAILDAVGLRENDRVELIQREDSIQIKRAASVPHRTLEERLIAFTGSRSIRSSVWRSRSTTGVQRRAGKYGDDL